MKRAIDILQAIEWALKEGHSPAMILDENSPIRDDMRELLKPADPQAEAVKVLAEDGHEPNANCWCGPELDYVDPDSGAAVYVHKRAH